MTDDPRHPHLADGYFTQAEPADMAARPVSIDTPPTTMSTGTSAGVTITSDTATVAPTTNEPMDGATMRSGQALEEMSVPELRKRASARGINPRGLRKAALIAKLRA